MGNKRALLARRYYGTAARDPRLEQHLHHEMDESSQQLNRAFFTDRSSPSRLAAGRERAVLLADALAALPKHYRGYTMPEVAQALDRTVDSVKKLWARAMVQLRSKLKHVV
jgi:RNA polymerase sigma-70 factor (ECF subfamily)